jgi:ribosomal protein L35
MGFNVEGTMIQEAPTMIDSLRALKVIQIAAGANHLMAITDDGQLYSWGCGEQGQLGRRVLERHKLLGLRPTNITPRLGRSRVVIRKVVCGSYHTLAISEDGDLWAMGLNNYGQLGLADHEERLTAELVAQENWRGQKVIDAAAGEHHSLVLLASGHVLTFGRADSGQLGVETTERAIPVPTHVTSLVETTALLSTVRTRCAPGASVRCISLAMVLPKMKGCLASSRPSFLDRSCKSRLVVSTPSSLLSKLKWKRAQYSRFLFIFLSYAHGPPPAYSTVPMLRSLTNLSASLIRGLATVKCKTNKSASKRFKSLLSGDYSFTKSGRNHNFAKKSCPRRTSTRQSGLTEGFQTELLKRMRI